CRNIHKFTAFDNLTFFQIITPPHRYFSANDINRGFVIFVHMGIAAVSRWNGKVIHAESFRPNTLRGDTFQIAKSLLALERLRRTQDAAGGFVAHAVLLLDMTLLMSIAYHVDEAYHATIIEKPEENVHESMHPGHKVCRRAFRSA